MIFVAITLGIIGTGWGLFAAGRANNELMASNAKLDEALEDAEAERNLAQKNEVTAKAEAERAARRAGTGERN